MSMCCFCHGEAIKDFILRDEIFCRYKCYDRMYSLEKDDNEEDEE